MRSVLLIALTFFSLPAWSQSSANFTVASSTFNNGGMPGNGALPTSANYHISVAAIGDTVSAATLSSTSFTIDIGFVASTHSPAVIFSDGFESGDTSLWTSTVGKSPGIGKVGAGMVFAGHDPEVPSYPKTGPLGVGIAYLGRPSLLDVLERLVQVEILHY